MSLEQDVVAHLQHTVDLGGYHGALVCTDQGLLIAGYGSIPEEHSLAALTCLFDDIVTRAERDLEMPRIDEITLLVPRKERLIVRPLALQGSPRLFLVVSARSSSTWRRNTTRLCAHLVEELADFVQDDSP